MRYLSLFVICIALASCDGGRHHKSAVSAAHKMHLNDSTMYNRDSVMAAFLQAKGIQDEKAEKLFLKAINEYRNNKNPKAGITLFKASVKQQPTAKAYFEMGNAASDLDLLPEGVWAYKMAEALDYRPLSKLLFNMACNLSRQNITWEARGYLVAAIEMGYDNANNIMKDKDLDNFRRVYLDDQFKQTLASIGDPDKLQWNMFYHEFEPLTFPVVLDEPFATNIKTHELSYNHERYIAEMRDNKFSRDVGSLYYGVGIVRNTDSVKTLIYAVQNVMLGENTPPYYFIASFTPNGKLIDKLMIAGHDKLTAPFGIATLQESGDFSIQYIQQVYEKDPEEEGYENNKIVETKELNKALYRIDDGGYFIKRSTELGMLHR